MFFENMGSNSADDVFGRGSELGNGRSSRQFSDGGGWHAEDRAVFSDTEFGHPSDGVLKHRGEYRNGSGDVGESRGP